MTGERGLWTLRATAVAAFLGTFVATHWPALELSPAMPGDTLLHAVSFAGLTALLWRARIASRIPWLLACMLAWAAFDELTQAIPAVRRHASLADWTSDALGAAAACMVIATAPSPAGPLSRLRCALADAADRALLDRPANWMAIGSGAALGALVGGPLCAALAWFVLLDRRPAQSLFIGAASCAVAGGHMMWVLGLRHWMRRICRERRCLACGAREARPAQGEAPPLEEVPAAGACDSCGAPWERIQWVETPEPFSSGRRVPVRWLAPAVAWAALATVAVTFALQWVARAIDGGPAAGASIDVRRGVAAVTVYVSGITALSVIAWHARREWLRIVERSDRSCLACGHDLSHADAPGGIGRCPECGGAFVRPERSAATG